jgi:hypothetical protein
MRLPHCRVLQERLSPLRVKGCLRDDVGIMTGVPRIADDLLQRPGRESRARSRLSCICSFHGDVTTELR